jgi:hypothetical protein
MKFVMTLLPLHNTEIFLGNSLLGGGTNRHKTYLRVQNEHVLDRIQAKIWNGITALTSDQ